MSSMLDDVHFTEKYLEKLKVRDQRLVTRSVMDTAKFNVMPTVHNELLVSLSAYVLADHRIADTQRAEYEIPSSWWQHFKRDCTPKWFIKRYPVKYEILTHEFDFDRYATYPEADVSLSREFGLVVMSEAISSHWDKL